MFEKFDWLLDRYQELSEALSQPDIIADQPKWQALLKEGGFQTVAMALREDARVLWDPALTRISKLAVVMGSEGPGLKASTIASCDYTVTVPMTNGVDSLNVAAASAVAFYQLALLRQHPL